MVTLTGGPAPIIRIFENRCQDIPQKKVLFLDSGAKPGDMAVMFFCFGYSHRKKAMGWVLVHALSEGGECKIRYAPFLWFPNIEVIRDYALRLGHAPKTDREKAEGLRLVYKSELDTKFPLSIGGGIFK